MNCPTCQANIPEGSRFCPNCGATVPQAAAVGNYSEPVPERDNPKEPIRIGDMSIRVEGELVPVVDVELGTSQAVYFEHHILLWKQPQVQLGMMGVKNAAKRFFAGLQIFISTAQGPGNIAFSREAPGQIVAMRLQPGQAIDVREHQFLLATSTVDYDFYWQQGLANVLFARTGLFIDRFTAQRGEGLVLLHGYGNVFEKQLGPGEQLDVEPGGWLWKDANVRMDTVSVLNTGGRGLMGAVGMMMGGASFMLNRFSGPGRVGIQSMTYHEPQAEGAAQAGGTSNIGNALNSFFNPRQ